MIKEISKQDFLYKILVIDKTDDKIANLKKIFDKKYDIIWSSNQKQTDEELLKNSDTIKCILLCEDVNTLSILEENKNSSKLPIIVLSYTRSIEKDCLKKNAYAFVLIPADDEIILYTVLNATARVFSEKKRDELTNSFKIEIFKNSLSEILHTNTDTTYLLAKFDIDRFKFINKYYGTKYGDELLKELCKRIMSYKTCIALGRVEETDVFYIISKSTPSQFIENSTIFINSFKITFNNINLSFSTGVYQIKNNEEDIESIFSRVSLAHSKAKLSNQKSVVVFEPSLEDNVFKSQYITNAFYDAMANQEFVPYIQPKYNMFTNMYYGGEVLVRWIKPDNTIIQPGEFIPVLESNGQIQALDHYMFIQTAKIIRNWIDTGVNPVPLSVNISRADFYIDSLFDKIMNILNQYEIPHEYFQIEITESAYFEQEEVVLDFVNKMTNEGIKVLMDDFGSGYSSLNMLKDIDISVLKVDYIFLKKSKIEIRRKKIIESIVRMARQIDIPVVFEGLETEEDAKFLKSIGVRYVQGYLYGKPMPLAEFDKLKKLKINYALKEFDVNNLYKDLLDENSTAYSLFNISLSSASICEYKNNKLIVMLTNKTMQESTVIALNNLNHSSRDYIEFARADDRKRLIGYLDSICETKPCQEYIEVDFYTPLGYVREKAKFTLLGKNHDSSIILMEAIKLYDVNDSINNENKIYTLLDNSNSGYFILDNHDVLYSNAIARRIMPWIIPGGKCTNHVLPGEDCNNCPFDKLNIIQTHLSKNTDSFIEFYATKIAINNKSLKLVRVDQKKVADTIDQNIFYRLSKSIIDTNSVYTEINLDTMEYNQISSQSQYFDVPSHGDYRISFKHMVDERITQKSNTNVIKYLAPEALINNYNESFSVTVEFKLLESGFWASSKLSYFTLNGCKMAAIFNKDVTSEYQKNLDSMTGLLNAKAGETAIEKYLLDNCDKRTLLISLDVNHFKAINDNLGHPIGDKVINLISKALLSLPDNCKYQTRHGGDEFMFIITDFSTKEEGLKIKDYLNNKINNIKNELFINIDTSVSNGYALYPDDGVTFKELYNVSDERLYVEKNKFNN